MQDSKIILFAESEGAAAPYKQAIEGLLSEVSGAVIIDTVLLPEKLKEAKNSPMEDWNNTVTPIMSKSIYKAGLASGDVAVICSNDLSIVTDELIEETGVRVIDLNMANYASMLEYNEMMPGNEQIKTVGVLATKRLMNASYFEDGLKEKGVSVVLPSEESQDRLNEIIYGPMISGEMTKQDEEDLVGMLLELKEQGADAIVSACRLISVYLEEAGLVGVYDDKEFVEPSDNSPVPWIDSTKSVAQQAVNTLS